MRMVYIKWLDACGQHQMEWSDLEDAVFGLETCETMGWIIHDDDTSICVAQNIHREGYSDENPRVAGVTTIPKASIQTFLYVTDAGMCPVKIKHPSTKDWDVVATTPTPPIREGEPTAADDARPPCPGDGWTWDVHEQKWTATWTIPPAAGETKAWGGQD